MFENSCITLGRNNRNQTPSQAPGTVLEVHSAPQRCVLLTPDGDLWPVTCDLWKLSMQFSPLRQMRRCRPCFRERKMTQTKAFHSHQTDCMILLLFNVWKEYSRGLGLGKGWARVGFGQGFGLGFGQELGLGRGKGLGRGFLLVIYSKGR